MTQIAEIEEFAAKVTEDRRAREVSTPQAIAEPCPPRRITESSDSIQWAVLGDGAYRAVGQTVPELPPAVYGTDYDQNGNVIFIRKRIITDELVVLPDTASERVLRSIQTFWTRRDSFRAMKQIFKRGIMLWGPPGSGKTVTLMLLVKDLIGLDGIAILVDHPERVTKALEQLRRIEPDRPAICVLEDIDEMIVRHGEHSILALLDGETQVDNVVYIATTNYPEMLDKRLVNRPSRFDEVIKIGMPSEDARRVYLRSRLGEDELKPTMLAKWLSDSEGFSIAHLREMVVAVFCLGRDYEETLARLRGMFKTLDSNREGRTVGLK
jgi:AAA+ superfamily predicted ATPase